METKLDFDGVEDRLFPTVSVSSDKLTLRGTDGNTTICNLGQDADDNIGPQVFIIDPVNNQTVYGSLQVRVAAIDPNHNGLITRLYYKVDNGSFVEVPLTATRALDKVIDIPAAAGGHVITIKVRDDFGAENTTSISVFFNDGKNVSVTLNPVNVEQGEEVSISIQQGLPNTTFTVAFVDGPSQKQPPGGVLNAAGGLTFNYNTSQLTNGSYTWAFKFSNGVTKNVSLAVSLAKTPVLTLSDYNIVELEPAIVSIDEARSSETWTLGGTAGVTGSLLTDASGHAEVSKQPAQSGTITATNSRGTVLTKNITVASSVGARLTVTPSTVVEGNTVEVTITGSVEGYVYALSGTAGVTGSIIIGSDGSGRTTATPTGSGTVIGTRNTQQLTGNVVVNPPVYAPQLFLNVSGQNPVTALTQISRSTDVMFSITGSRPNITVSKIVDEQGVERDLWVRNVGGQWIFLNGIETDNPGGQPSNSQNLPINANGQALGVLKPQTNWPFTDADGLTTPPVDLKVKFKLSDGSETNFVDLKWARSYQLRAANATQNPTVLDKTLAVMGLYATNVVYDFNDMYIFSMGSFDPSRPLMFSQKNVDSFADSDFAQLQGYQYSMAGKDLPLEPILTDTAGGQFYYAGVYNNPDLSGAVMYAKAMTDTNKSGSVTLNFRIFNMVHLNKTWAAMFINAGQYNPNDASMHYIINNRYNDPAGWLPVAINLRKVWGDTAGVSLIARGGRVGERVYYSINNGNNWTDTGVNIGSDLSAAFIANFPWDDVNATTMTIKTRVGTDVSRNSVLINVLAPIGEKPPVATLPPPAPALNIYYGYRMSPFQTTKFAVVNYQSRGPVAENLFTFVRATPDTQKAPMCHFEVIVGVPFNTASKMRLGNLKLYQSTSNGHQTLLAFALRNRKTWDLYTAEDKRLVDGSGIVIPTLSQDPQGRTVMLFSVEINCRNLDHTASGYATFQAYNVDWPDVIANFKVSYSLATLASTTSKDR